MKCISAAPPKVFQGSKRALRLGPRDPGRSQWGWEVCHLHAHLAQWDQAIEWRQKLLTNYPQYFPYVDLAAAFAWTGRDADARASVAELLKLKPGFTVQQWVNRKRSDNPTYLREEQPILEGLRKAGLREQ
jgi:adenylate cyclase